MACRLFTKEGNRLPLNSVPDDFTVDHWDDMGEAKTGINHDRTFRKWKVWMRE